MIAIIQAGGKGTRLRPYSLLLPKPIMPLGDEPVIAVLLKWLRRWGISQVIITIGYLGQFIRALCGDGSQWDLNIRYSEEPEPLGTIGPLKLIEDRLTETFLVLNGDLISDIKLGDFLAAHRQHKAHVTVAATQKPVSIDLGVLEKNQNSRLTGFREKPTLDLLVSMGIYLIEPPILDLIPKGVPFGFDDLMYTMLNQNLPVYLYEHEGLWMDLGRKEDFSLAQESYLREYKHRILGA